MFSEISYDERRFMTFRANNECYDDIHDIVCLNKSILCTSVHIGMENNVDEESFHFRYTKIISHFPSVENGLFCEGTTKNML